jgi:hypothetical protein
MQPNFATLPGFSGIPAASDPDHLQSVCQIVAIHPPLIGPLRPAGYQPEVGNSDHVVTGPFPPPQKEAAECHLFLTLCKTTSAQFRTGS